MLDSACLSDLRRHKRVKTARTARIGVDNNWQNCVILDISGGGALLTVEAPFAAGTPVMLCDGDWGIFAATVTRCDGGTLAVRFGVPEGAKQGLIISLMLYLNGGMDP
ncbi:MAG: PilZ domain-containing protein [Kiloniellales bacterium]|nr:PilZ domain-containing protein [Kiloniellales bacterium]